VSEEKDMMTKFVYLVILLAIGLSGSYLIRGGLYLAGGDRAERHPGLLDIVIGLLRFDPILVVRDQAYGTWQERCLASG
jgi:hypothetical protein